MNKQQLAAKIWQSANKMRSKIEANEYKDYILGFIFYKFLSDLEERTAREQGADAAVLKAEFHETNAEVVTHIQSQLGYFIAYENLFSTWLTDEDFTVANVRDALSAFNRLMAKSHKKVFEKIFNTLETGFSKLGDSAASQTKAIRSLLNLIKDIPMDGRQDYDVLGFVYEYLIGMFAANAGKKAGEFYTPHEVAMFMAEIVADHLKERKEIQIYDPTSGSGSLLINIGKAVSRYLNDPNKIKYYAQELKENTYNLTRMNLVMRGILPANIEVRNGDTLERDWPYFDESNPENSYEPLFVDAVVSNPPYSQHWEPKGRESDVRYAGFGVAPKSKADYAFLLHDLYHLRDDGIMTIVLPHGVLFRGTPDDGSEGAIRRALVEGNHIEAVIGLPANIFFGTGIPTIVMVLRKKREESDTLFVDASQGFVKDGKKNRLQASDIKRISDAVINRWAMPGFSRLVSRDEIRKNEYNLNIPRYLSRSESEMWDIRSIMFGGIPNRELDQLMEYWQTFDGLRESVFTIEGNYSNVKEEPLATAIRDHESVADYTRKVADALDGFDAFLKSELIDHMMSVQINGEEARISTELFKRLKDIPMLDAYKAYQILDDEWRTTSTDLEIIQSEGFESVRKVDPNMVLKKSGDEEVEVQQGWVGRIIPFGFVQRVKFSKELEEIQTRMVDADRCASELVALASEVPEDERDNLIEDDGEEFDAKKVAAKVIEILADIETPELVALEAYAELTKAPEKKAFHETHPECEWAAMSAVKNGTYAKAEVRRRIVTLRESYEFPEDSSEALVLKAHRLIGEEKALRSEIKTLIKELDAKTKTAIETLTDAEAIDLIKLKWVVALVNKLEILPNTIVDELIAKVAELAKKYAVTLSAVTERINAAEAELSGLIGELTGEADDLAGLAAWQKDLAK